MVQALQAQNLAAPVGRLNGQLDERTIRLRGRLETPADFAQLVVAESRAAASIRLGDVADVARRHRGAALARRSSTASEAVGIDIMKAKGYSTTAVADAVREQVERDPGRRCRRA